MSKGSNRRVEDTQKIRNNWDAIFNKRPETPNLDKLEDDSLKAVLNNAIDYLDSKILSN